MNHNASTDEDRETPSSSQSSDEDRQTPCNDQSSDEDQQTPCNGQSSDEGQQALSNGESSDEDRQTPSNGQSSDEDRQTPSNGQRSSNDMSSVSSETLLSIHENDQPQMSKTHSVHVSPVKVNSCSNLPNLKIRHPYRLDDDGDDPFNDERRIIRDKHVQVSHINRASLRCLTTDVPLLRSNASSRQKRMGTVTVSRGSQRLSQRINGNLNNQEPIPTTSRQNTVRVSRISTSDNINQKEIVSKPLVTRASRVNEPTLKMKQKVLHVSVRHGSVNFKTLP